MLGACEGKGQETYFVTDSESRVLAIALRKGWESEGKESFNQNHSLLAIWIANNGEGIERWEQEYDDQECTVRVFGGIPYVGSFSRKKLLRTHRYIKEGSNWVERIAIDGEYDDVRYPYKNTPLFPIFDCYPKEREDRR